MSKKKLSKLAKSKKSTEKPIEKPLKPIITISPEKKKDLNWWIISILLLVIGILTLIRGWNIEGLIFTLVGLFLLSIIILKSQKKSQTK